MQLKGFFFGRIWIIKPNRFRISLDKFHDNVSLGPSERKIRIVDGIKNAGFEMIKPCMKQGWFDGIAQVVVIPGLE